MNSCESFVSYLDQSAQTTRIAGATEGTAANAINASNWDMYMGDIKPSWQRH